MIDQPSHMEPLAATPRIVELRGLRVILDGDLAALYGVEKKRLNEQVRRNPDRFPQDFLIQPSNQELALIWSQIGDGSRFSVDAMAVTDKGCSQPDEGGDPQER